MLLVELANAASLHGEVVGSKPAARTLFCITYSRKVGRDMGRPISARGVCARLRTPKERAQRAPFRVCQSRRLGIELGTSHYDGGAH